MTTDQIINITAIASLTFTVCIIIASIGFKMIPRIAVSPPWWLSRRSKNFLGRLVEFGECGCCGDTWNWKEAHTTPIRDADGELQAGIFALCEECWTDLAIPEERERYYNELFDDWMKTAPHHIRIRIEQEDRPAAMRAVYEGK
jgi:hypothetical protein